MILLAIALKLSEDGNNVVTVGPKSSPLSDLLRSTRDCEIHSALIECHLHHIMLLAQVLDLKLTYPEAYQIQEIN